MKRLGSSNSFKKIMKMNNNMFIFNDKKTTRGEVVSIKRIKEAIEKRFNVVLEKRDVNNVKKTRGGDIKYKVKYYFKGSYQSITFGLDKNGSLVKLYLRLWKSYSISNEYDIYDMGVNDILKMIEPELENELLIDSDGVGSGSMIYLYIKKYIKRLKELIKKDVDSEYKGLVIFDEKDMLKKDMLYEFKFVMYSYFKRLKMNVEGITFDKYKLNNYVQVYICDYKRANIIVNKYEYLKKQNKICDINGETIYVLLFVKTDGSDQYERLLVYDLLNNYKTIRDMIYYYVMKYKASEGVNNRLRVIKGGFKK